MILVIGGLAFGLFCFAYAVKRRSLIEKYNGFGAWAAPVGDFDMVDWKKKKNEIPDSFTRELNALNARFAVAFLIIASGFAIYAMLDWLIE